MHTGCSRANNDKRQSQSQSQDVKSPVNHLDIHRVLPFPQSPTTCDFSSHFCIDSMAPTPLTPSSSQEIVPISPPPPAALKRKREVTDPSASITLPKPLEWKPSIDLKDKAYRARNAYEQKVDTQGGKKKARQAEVEKQREEVRGMSREKQTARMVGPPLRSFLHRWDSTNGSAEHAGERGQPNNEL